MTDETKTALLSKLRAPVADERANVLPDPHGCNKCQHADCGRFDGPHHVECRAMADNACARDYAPASAPVADAVPVKASNLDTRDVDVEVHAFGSIFYDHGPNLAEALGRLAQRVARWRNLPAPSLASAPVAGEPVPYVLGNQYRTQGGDLVKLVTVANAGTSYESMACEAGVHRYTRRDLGRVTGSPHDYSDPRNIPPLYAAPQASEAVRPCTCQPDWSAALSAQPGAQNDAN